MSAKRSARLLADNRDHRLAVELSVIESVQQMDGARSRGCKANADITGQLGVSAGHERSFFLMPDLNELDRVSGAAKRGDDPVNPVAGIAKDALYAPRLKTFQKKIADRLCHGNLALLQSGNGCVLGLFRKGSRRNSLCMEQGLFGASPLAGGLGFKPS